MKFNIGDIYKIIANGVWEGDILNKKYGIGNIRRNYNKDEIVVVNGYDMNNIVVKFISDNKYVVCYDRELVLIKEIIKAPAKKLTPAEQSALDKAGWGF